MSHKLRQLLLCIGIPLAVGGLSAWITRGAMEEFQALNQPPLSPPGWLFPVVWSVLFVLMGIASYLALRAPAPEKTVRRALIFYGIQLGFNFLWSILFFNLGLYLVSFFLAHPAVVPHSAHHPAIFRPEPPGRLPDAALPLVGRLRRVSQPGHLYFEPIDEKSLESKDSRLFGGDKRDRTADLLNAIQALSQLSYTPVFSCVPCGTSVSITGVQRKVKLFFQKNFFFIFLPLPPKLPPVIWCVSVGHIPYRLPPPNIPTQTFCMAQLG